MASIDKIDDTSKGQDDISQTFKEKGTIPVTSNTKNIV